MAARDVMLNGAAWFAQGPGRPVIDAALQQTSKVSPLDCGFTLAPPLAISLDPNQPCFGEKARYSVQSQKPLFQEILAVGAIPRDEASLASVNRDTFNTLDEHRHVQLMGLVQQARTLADLMRAVHKTLTLADGLRAGLLEAAGHQLGRLAHGAPGPDPGAPFFQVLWNAIVELPDKHCPKPLFAVARQVAVLPAQERLAAMTAALAPISRISRDNKRFGSYETTRFQTVRDYAYLLPSLPAPDRAPALQRLSIAGEASS